MNRGPGWYIAPGNSRLELYWNGSEWTGQPRKRQDGTPIFPELPDPYDDQDLSHEERMEALSRAQLAQQTRSANYLAIITYITVVLLVLGVAGVVIGVIAGQS